jgi:pseudouridine-5'-phosphate glycosidase
VNASEHIHGSAVSDAHGAGRALVVLESTVVGHGLPWPENLETALAMEAAVAAAGAVPATIAVIEGLARVGLTRAELERVARSRESIAPERTSRPGGSMARPGEEFVKANRRDLAAVVGQGRSAATTVSATLWLARRARLDPCIMATGGLGGVHRGAAETFDVSADLDELAQADGCVVVCSGFKSILDLPATLEVMETRGVAIIGYRSGDLPAFTTTSSGLPLEHRVESAAEAAALVRTHRELRLPGAIVLANPVPAADALERSLAEACLEQALADARTLGVSGKAVTPFLLEALQRGTGGKSLAANRALLIANASLAAELAVLLCDQASSA